MKPREPNGVRIPVFIPKVTVRWERDPFSLTSVNTTLKTIVDSSSLDGADGAPLVVR